MITTPQFTILEQRGLLAISGPDRVDFLQGLVSNDIEKVSTNRTVYAALLSPQGKYLYDFFIYKLNNTFFLDCEKDSLNELKKRLSLYKLRSNVTLEDYSDKMVVIALFGNTKSTKQELPTKPGHTITFGEGVLCTDPRISDIGWRCLLPSTKAENFVKSFGFTHAQCDTYEKNRLLLGLPDGSRDLIFEKSILLESGFSELNGIDWGKGCYIGQELTARTKYRGLIKKRLMPVKFDGPPPKAGTLIYSENKIAGEIRSNLSTKNTRIGMAFIRLEALKNSTKLIADGVLVRPSRPHWMLDEL